MPEPKLLLPKFLTEEVARMAIHLATSGFLKPYALGPLNKGFHVVVLAPAMKDDRATDYSDWPNYPIQPHLIAETSFGVPALWPYDYANIAHCKALQLWTGRNDGGTNIQPHLLFPSDTPFWGGVKREGIVVACSGLDEWFDRMIAGMTADACIGLSYEKWLRSADKADDKLCFLT